MKRMKRTGLWLAVPFALLGSVCACPICDSETGNQVREGIFGKEFGTNVLLTLAPVPVLFGMIALASWAIPDLQQLSRSNQGKSYEQ
jgi:hypothetical protein